MLGSDRSRGCLEMICADFLAGANLENGNSDVLLPSLQRSFAFPLRGAPAAVPARHPAIGMSGDLRKRPRFRLDPERYRRLKLTILERDGWRCQACGSLVGLEIHHIQRRSQSGDDSEGNLITLCSDCHRATHAYWPTRIGS